MIKKEMVTKEEETTFCDGCGVVITEDNKGIFSVVEYYNGASYRKRGEEVVGYETGTYLNKFGNFCIDGTSREQPVMGCLVYRAGPDARVPRYSCRYGSGFRRYRSSR